MSKFGYRFRVRTARAAAAGTAAALGVLGAELAVAQGDPALEVDVGDCVQIESPAERFRCYESRVDSALREQSSSSGQSSASPTASAPASPPIGVPASPPIGVPASPPVSAPASPPVSASASPPISAPAGGASPSVSTRESAPEPVPERDIAVGGQAAAPDNFGFPSPRAKDEDGEEQPQEVFSTVTALRETVPNTFLITLENGQVWRQTVPKWYPIRPGSEVRVYLSRFGYRLTALERNGFIQVERAR